MGQIELVNDHLKPYIDIINSAETSYEKHFMMWCIENSIVLNSFKKEEIFIIFYEYLITDPVKSIKKLYKHLNLNFNNKIIDKVQVRLNESKDIYEATFINLGLKKIQIAGSIVKKHKKLLSGGVWCIVNMGYLYEDGEKIPWLLHDLKPIQISNINLEELIVLRKEFTKDEWVDLLIQSLGLEPSQFNFRSKLIQLTRLIPHCENNFNFIELGPKGTGKSQ